MRRYLKPIIVTAAAGGAALIVATSGGNFNSAPVAKTKTIECTTTTGVLNAGKKVGTKTIPTLKPIQIPCDRLTNISVPALPAPTVPEAVYGIPGKLQDVADRLAGLGTTTTTEAPTTTSTPPTSSPPTSAPE